MAAVGHSLHQLASMCAAPEASVQLPPDYPLHVAGCDRHAQQRAWQLLPAGANREQVGAATLTAAPLQAQRPDPLQEGPVAFVYAGQQGARANRVCEPADVLSTDGLF